jgi:hypothetical protein
MGGVIQRIKHKLAYLRDHEDYDVTDGEWARTSQVRTSKKYRYTLKPPASEAQVAEFEAQHKIELPEDYRRFLLEVGTRGAGPGFHLLSPFEDLKTEEEVRQLSEDEKQFWDEFGFGIGDLSQLFPFIGADTTEIVNALEEAAIEQDGTHGLENLLLAGYLMVGYSGCQCWNLLITAGEERGNVWYMDGIYLPEHARFSEQANYIPAADERVTFTQWYEAWLDNDTAIAQNHWQKRGRTIPPIILTEND